MATVVKKNTRSQDQIRRSLGLSGNSVNSVISGSKGVVTPTSGSGAAPAGWYGDADQAIRDYLDNKPSEAISFNPPATAANPAVTVGQAPAASGSAAASRSKVTSWRDLTAPTFSRSQRTIDYENALADIEDDRPGPFRSKYTEAIDGLLDTIMNPKEFSLDDDDTYKRLYDNYRESYMAQGNRAMRDVMGSAAALTGGYGSSAAATAASQAYDNYLQQINDRNLDLYQMALNNYWQNRNDYYNQLGAVQGQDAVDYGRHRDEVADWQNDRAYYAGQAQTSYGNDFGMYQSGLEQYNNEAGRLQSQEQFDANMEWQREQAAQEQANWEKEFALKQAQLAMAAARGGSGGGGSRRSSGGNQSQTGTTVRAGQPFASGIGYTENRNKVARIMNGQETDFERFNTVESAVDSGTITPEQGEELLLAAGIDPLKGLKEEPKYMNGFSPILRAARAGGKI